MLIELDDVTLHVSDTGAGTPVVLLHGWPDTADLWRHQVPVLAAAGYRVVALDLRGFGRSSRPDDVAAYQMSHLIGDVTRVLDHLSIPRAHLVGHDWGAAVAWRAATLVPDRVATVTGLSVGHTGSMRAAGWAQREKSWYMLLFQFPGIAEEWLSANNFRNLREWSGHPDADAVAERLSEPGALTASLNVYRANVHPRTLIEPPRDAPPIRAPAMGVWSSGDIALTERSMTGTSRYVAGPWRYERLEGIGHWMQLEAPDTVSRLLLDFLGRYRDAQP